MRYSLTIKEGGKITFDTEDKSLDCTTGHMNIARMYLSREDLQHFRNLLTVLERELSD